MFVDIQGRMTVQQALSDEYLVVGSLDDPMSDEAARVDPKDFHNDKPIQIPKSSDSHQSSADDKLWSRRQFSRLWAPMATDSPGGDSVSILLGSLKNPIME